MSESSDRLDLDLQSRILIPFLSFKMIFSFLNDDNKNWLKIKILILLQNENGNFVVPWPLKDEIYVFSSDGYHLETRSIFTDAS